MATQETTWRLQRRLAELRDCAVTGCVDVSHPEFGLHDLEFNGRKIAGRLLCIRRQEDDAPRPPRSDSQIAWPLAVADAYVRGSDLVASYSANNEWPYSPQIYWRANAFEEPRGVVASLSILISVQTHLLDTWPLIGIESQLACSEVLRVISTPSKESRAEPLEPDQALRPSGDACCILRRLRDLPLSYAEMMLATDFRELRLWRDSEAQRRAEWELLGEFLEKGVIRRARLEAVFLPREDDIQLAAECCKLMQHRPLPLTT